MSQKCLLASIKFTFIVFSIPCLNLSSAYSHISSVHLEGLRPKKPQINKVYYYRYILQKGTFNKMILITFHEKYLIRYGADKSHIEICVLEKVSQLKEACILRTNTSIIHRNMFHCIFYLFLDDCNIHMQGGIVLQTKCKSHPDTLEYLGRPQNHVILLIP